MNIREIRRYAVVLGIRLGKGRKAELIRKIQLAEGNFDCYKRASDTYCDQSNCLWRMDCLKTPRTMPTA